MDELGSTVVTIPSASTSSTVRLTSRQASSSEKNTKTESEPLLPSPSHQTHYVPLLTADHGMPPTTTAVLRPALTTTTDTLSSSHSSTKDRSSLIQIELPESFSRRNDRNPPKESSSLLKTLLSFLFVFVNMNINLTVLAIIHERVPRSQPPLPDIAFDVLPKAFFALDIAEYVIVAQVVGVAILLFLHRYRVIIFRRLCLIMGILYLLRAICMASTQLPLANSHYFCSPQMFNGSDPSSYPTTGQYISTIASRVFYMSLGMGLSINGRHSFCGDYIFSGHTVILTLAYLMFREYFIPSRCRKLSWKVFNVLLWVSSLMGVICVMIARGHYFIDIVLAYFITTRVFWIYHTLCYNNPLRFESPTNYLSRVWWWRLFKYIEGNHVLNCPAGTRSDGRPCNCCDGTFPQVPRSFEWPLPWPRILRRRRTQRLLQSQQA